MSVTTRVRSKAAERLLNRELSWLEFNARVLALAADERVPLLERLKFASIFSSNLDEFFMVRVAGLMGQAAAGFGVRSPGWTIPGGGVVGDPRPGARADRRAVPHLEPGAASGSGRRGHLHPPRRRVRRGRAGRALPAVRPRRLPRPHPARARPRPALPLHLGALPEPRRVRARPRDRRGAIRAREGARRPPPLRLPREARVPRPARCGDRAFP